jgi:uncharacterized repeat protein (TIGR03806 family)
MRKYWAHHAERDGYYPERDGDRRRGIGALLLMLLVLGCGKEPSIPVTAGQEDEPPAQLSAYGLFVGTGATQEPAAGVVPYDINTALFSDDAEKFRFVRLPTGTAVRYDPEQVFEFPVGTILVKTFAYPRDARDPSQGRRLIETRLLIRRADKWIGLPYVWNADQTEATLRIIGGLVEVTWRDQSGQERHVPYQVPNTNHCKGCHENNKEMRPIGLRADQLNRVYPFGEGAENQLSRWVKLGILREGPADPHMAPRLAVWDNPTTGTLDERARAWLDVNCAHCHNPEGPAKNTGLDLRKSQNDPAKWGVWKAPVAAGKGTGGRSYAIVPGKPDESIVMYRLESTEPGVLMPDLGRRTVDRAGNALVRAWIGSLK